MYLLDRGDEIYSVHEDETQRLQRLTVETAMKEGINPTVPVYVVAHESDWKPDAIGDHGLAHNVAQFHKPTFDWMKQKAGMPDLDYSSSTDQIILMEWALKNGEGRQWTTYRRLENIK